MNEIEKLLETISPWPWITDHDNDYIASSIPTDDWVVIGGGNHPEADKELAEHGERYGVQKDIDAEFIARSPEIISSLLKEIKQRDAVIELVNNQAEDEGLWFEAKTAPEAYLQHQLRLLHATIERELKNERV